MAQGRAGDDGHIQKARIAQKPAKLCLICQRLMEGGPVGAVSRVDEDGRQPGSPVVVQTLDQCVDIRLLGCRVCRLGQHQHCQFLAAGFRHRQVEKVEVLCHDGLQRLVVIGAGGLVLSTAEILDGHRSTFPAVLLQAELRHRLKGQVVHTGEQGVPLAQLRPEIGDLVFLDAVLLRGVVDADQYPELPVRRLLQSLEHGVAKPQLPLPGGQIVLHGSLRQRLLRLHRDGGSVRPQGVVRHNVPDGQTRALQVGTGCHAVSPQGIVLVEAEPAVAGGGRQPHDCVQQPDPVVLIRCQQVDHRRQQLRFHQCLSGGKRHRVLPSHSPGADQPAGEQLIQGQDVPVTPGGLLLSHPLVQCSPVPVLGPVLIRGLAVQPGAVQVPLRHGQLVAQGFRQVYHPLGVVWPVIQRYVGDHRRTGPGGLLFHRLRPHRPAPCQKRTGQRRCQHPSSHGMFSCFQKSGAIGSAPSVLSCPTLSGREKGQGKTFGFPQLICLRQLKNLKPFSAGYAPAENTWTQPPWAASPVTAVVARRGACSPPNSLTVRMLPGPTHRWPARCSCPWPPRPGAGPHLQRIPPGPGASPHPPGPRPPV